MIKRLAKLLDLIELITNNLTPSPCPQSINQIIRFSRIHNQQSNAASLPTKCNISTKLLDLIEFITDNRTLPPCTTKCHIYSTSPNTLTSPTIKTHIILPTLPFFSSSQLEKHRKKK